MDIGQNSETQKFLEKCLGEKIKSFIVGPGSKPGDGYAALHYAFEIQFEKPGLATRKLFLKSFPNHPLRQEMMKKLNPFYKEFKFYCEIIPDFYKLQKEITGGSTPIMFNIPQIVSANATFYSEAENDKWRPEDNYILMEDMRECGFKKLHNFHRISYNEAEKIVEELAKFHVLSWAAKKRNGLETMSEKYPYWVETMFDEALKDETFKPMMETNENLFFKLCKEEFGENSPIYCGAREFFDPARFDHWDTVMDLVNSKGVDEKKVEKVLKKPFKNGLKDPIEDPWTVMTQGDPWINNMLFKHNDLGELEQVLLLDFQIFRESCPTLELAFILYICADLEFRKNHLSQILGFYHKTFLGFCETLKVPPFSNFTIENLERRFHRARIFGILSAIWFSPVVMNNPDTIKNIEHLESGKDGNENKKENMKDYINAAFNQGDHEGTPLKDILFGIARESHELGIF